MAWRSPVQPARRTLNVAIRAEDAAIASFRRQSLQACWAVHRVKARVGGDGVLRRRAAARAHDSPRLLRGSSVVHHTPPVEVVRARRCTRRVGDAPAARASRAPKELERSVVLACGAAPCLAGVVVITYWPRSVCRATPHGRKLPPPSRDESADMVVWHRFLPRLASGVALVVGTVLVYPTLLAGSLADRFGMHAAIGAVAARTAASGVTVALRRPRTLHAGGDGPDDTQGVQDRISGTRVGRAPPDARPFAPSRLPTSTAHPPSAHRSTAPSRRPCAGTPRTAHDGGSRRAAASTAPPAATCRP